MEFLKKLFSSPQSYEELIATVKNGFRRGIDDTTCRRALDQAFKMVLRESDPIKLAAKIAEYEAVKKTYRECRGKRLMTCRKCRHIQRDREWECEMDFKARLMGMNGFVNLSASPQCLSCGSTDLEPETDKDYECRCHCEAVRANRKAARQCVMCGRDLGLLDRLATREKHPECAKFVE